MKPPRQEADTDGLRLRISGLADRTGVPLATLKFYLREGVLHPGHARNRTQSDYDESHVRRVQLIRALADGAGLSLAEVSRVIDLLEQPPPRHRLLGEAQQTLLPDTALPDAPHDPWVAARYEDSCAPDLVALLSEQLADARRAGAILEEEQLAAFADASERIAEADLRSVPAEQDAAVRQVIVGTVMTDPVLRTMRLIEQQRASARRHDEGA